jgi:hypothetical protein
MAAKRKPNPKVYLDITIGPRKGESIALQYSIVWQSVGARQQVAMSGVD